MVRRSLLAPPGGTFSLRPLHLARTFAADHHLVDGDAAHFKAEHLVDQLLGLLPHERFIRDVVEIKYRKVLDLAGVALIFFLFSTDMTPASKVCSGGFAEH